MGPEFDLNKKWGKVYINGRLVDAHEAGVSVFDRGFLYGDGIYETIRVYSGKPFMLDRHLQRMGHGCEVIGLSCPPMSDVAEAVDAVLKANNADEAYLRIMISRGATGRMWYDISASKPSLLVITSPTSRKDFDTGVKLKVSSYRTDERSPLSGIKHTGILHKMMARAEAVREGFDDGLLLTTAGSVSEPVSSNIFWFDGETLFTPSLDCGILPGVTRSIVIELAQGEGIPIREGKFGLGDVLAAEEAFLTSSTWEIAPVYSLEKKVFQGTGGRITKRLSELYRACVSSS